MSDDYENDRTTTIERPKTNILDLIDERVEQNSTPEKSEIEREVERFDNSHTATNLQQAYDAIDRAAINSVTQTPQIERRQITKVDTVNNPFFGDSDMLTQLRNKRKPQYQDVVETPTVSPTLEINATDKAPAKLSATTKTAGMSTRKKMWIAAGAFCCVLLLVLIICNIFQIGAVDRSAADLESGIIVQEGELSDLNAIISNESGRIPEGMQDAGEGVIIDISPQVPTEVATSDNIFNKITEFFSYLFGR